MKQLICALLCVITGIGVVAQNKHTDSTTYQHQQMMENMQIQAKPSIKTIGILLYDGYQTLDAMGPYETLSNLMGAKVFFIAKQRGLIRNQRGLKVQVDTSINEVRQLDMLVIPGGSTATFMMTQDSLVLNWIKSIDQTTTYTTSVCTGAWILGATGLLQGKNVTTNWYRAEEMMKNYGANFEQSRWVHDGKYWTSAGVTAGIDMSLAIINELKGEKYTQGVMLNLEYNPNPPVKGGSIETTDASVKQMLQSLYDSYLQPLFDKYRNK